MSKLQGPAGRKTSAKHNLILGSYRNRHRRSLLVAEEKSQIIIRSMPVTIFPASARIRR
jgi:hypothetical protein